MNTVMITAVLGFAVGLLAPSAAANPFSSDDPPAQVVVTYADLDLHSPAGDQRLRNRIEYASYLLCLVDPGASPSPAFAEPTCYRNAKNDGLTQMQRAIEGSGGKVMTLHR